jgi:6-pyruvoyltetrahydropterin/6-carboxytetrahydropterin synthase
MLITKSFYFDAAHWLPNYVGKCSQHHGHTWKLTVVVGGTIDSKTGMVMDFADLAEIVNTYVIDRFDHQLLNDILDNPTCENLLNFIASLLPPNLLWMTLTLSEGKDSSASLSSGEYDLSLLNEQRQ